MLYNVSINEWKDDFTLQSIIILENVKHISHHMWEHLKNKNKEDISHNINEHKFFVILNSIKSGKKKYKIVEVETDSENRIVKSLIRTNYNKRQDITIVCDINCYVRTAWLNDKNDNHKTLNYKNYANNLK